MTICIGTAGWSIPRQISRSFPESGTSLERYAARFPVSEINSSFHRPHRASTWERWRDCVPEHFRFSVKMPKQITHQRKLVDCAAELDGFIEQASILGDKLAVLLVQLPPRLAFDPAVAETFFGQVAASSSAAIVSEPRHISWFTEEADEFLKRLKVARVAADPSICEPAGQPGGWPGLGYWRLHGSPVMYRSSYEDRVEQYARRISSHAQSGAAVWCIFDNTASSAAAGDALELAEALTR